MRKIVFLVLMVFSISGVADQRTSKIEQLMQAQGLMEIWQQQIELGDAEGKRQARVMIDQMLASMNPSEEFRARFEQAFMRFIGKFNNNWTAQQIVDVWAKFYGERFTDAELDQLLAFYTSEIGQKDISATKEAMVEFSLYFQKEMGPIMQKALDEYMAELKLVAAECNCVK